MGFSFDMRASVDPNVMIRTIGEESVILDLNTERYLGLDAIGTRMWSAIVEAPTIELAYLALLDEYDVEPDRLKDEVQVFLQKLVDNGLIQLTAANGAGDVRPE